MKNRVQIYPRVYALVGFILALITGSRFAYPLFTVGDTYFPEPLIFALIVLLCTFNKLHFYSKFFNRLLIFSFLYSLLILYSYLIGYDLNSIFRIARPLFVALGVPFIFLTPTFFHTLSRSSIKKILIFLIYYSFFSWIFGILSVYLQPNNEMLRFFGGLRTLQPSLVPLTMLLGLILYDKLSNKLTTISLSFYCLIANVLCLFQFLVGLSRFSLITLLPINLIFIVFLAFDDSFVISISSFKVKRSILIVFFVGILAIILNPFLINRIIDSIFASSASNQFGDYYSKISIFESQLSRIYNFLEIANSESTLDVRIASIFYLFLKFYDFIVPHGFNLGFSKYENNPNIDYALFSDLNSNFLSIKDSGILYIFYILGSVVVLYLLYLLLNFTIFSISQLQSGPYKLLFCYLSVLNASYLSFSLFSSDKFFAVYTESFHFAAFVFISYILTPIVLKRHGGAYQVGRVPLQGVNPEARLP